MSLIPKVSRYETRFEHEGFFSLYFEDQTYMEVPFYELLSWICETDDSLLKYLQGLPPYYTVYEEVEDLIELGYDFFSKFPGYLRHCELIHPGFLYEFRINIQDLPSNLRD